MIVFGQNHFKIKSFTQQELRLPKEEALNNIDIQVRQRYAHLFWIPFFPIGKIYGFKRKGDSNLYELPQDIKQIIQTRHSNEIKTPWYSYSLIVLALLVGLWFYMGNKLSKVSYENSFYLKQAENKMMVKYPTTGDSYHFDVYDNEEGHSYKKTAIVLQVNSYDDNTIEFTSNYENINAYDLDKKLEEVSEYIDIPTRISKSFLTKMTELDYGNRYDNSSRFKVKEYNNLYFKLKSIKRKKLKK